MCEKCICGSNTGDSQTMFVLQSSFMENVRRGEERQAIRKIEAEAAADLREFFEMIGLSTGDDPQFRNWFEAVSLKTRVSAGVITRKDEALALYNQGLTVSEAVILILEQNGSPLAKYPPRRVK